ncbi:MAG: DUF2029 domain-containing protein [Anaerolineae bacterium]|jgi:hypothetical protein|nr:DUF2029 domain-containing protein [Anaerolineae bacterium]MDH7472449.1 glycosyltransferase family 87 protein [Anaerolineae bacterium]
MISTRWQLCLLIVMAAVVFTAGVWITYTSFTSRYPGGNDFYARWVGGRALLREGLDPYSEAATLRIQEGIYGRPARANEDQMAFAYPLYSLILFWPLCLIENYSLVQAIWLWWSLAGLVVALMLWRQVIHWNPSPVVWALTVLWSVFLYQDFRALMLGQLVVLEFLAMMAALWAMQRHHDRLAGLFLALTTVKPQVVYLAIPWIMIWAAGQRRWRLWWGFGLSLILLLVGATLLLPTWISGFVRQVLTYPSYTKYGSLTWMIIHYWLGLGREVEIAVLIVLAAVALALAWRLWRGTWEQMLWMLGLLLLLTNFFTPRVGTPYYLFLVPWAIWSFSWMQQTWKRFGIWVMLAWMGASLVGLWVVFLITVKGNSEQIPVHFPFPAMVALLLVWLWKQGIARVGRVVLQG